MTAHIGTIHASAVAVTGRGVLIRGVAGSGKSALALSLIEDAREDSRLVADDRVLLIADGKRLFAAPPPGLAGRLEIRGIGIVRCLHVAPVELVLAIDLLPEEACARMPEEADRVTLLSGIGLPRVALPIGTAGAALRVRAALRATHR